MTPTQLRTFVEIAATGSVRQAAERLFVTPPAVSAALAALQKELGVSLVQREGRGLMLTSQGELFAGYSRRILGLLDEAVTAVAGGTDPERGRVRLAAVTTAGEHVVPGFLASFRTRYEHVEVTLEVGNRARVLEMLDNHEVDIAIGGRPPPLGRFCTKATRPNVFVVVAAPTSTGQRRTRRRTARSVPTAELERSVWLLREPGSGTRATVLELLDDLNIVPPRLTLGSNGAIRESVKVGLGITLISRDAVARELDNGDLEEWAIAGGPRPKSWHVVARADEDLPPTARLFLDHLTAVEGGPNRFHPGDQSGDRDSR